MAHTSQHTDDAKLVYITLSEERLNTPNMTRGKRWTSNEKEQDLVTQQLLEKCGATATHPSHPSSSHDSQRTLGMSDAR